MTDLLRAAPGNLGTLKAQGETLADLAADRWSWPAPGCPEWSAGDVVAHTGSVHRWVETTVRTGERVRRRDLPGPPEGRDATLAWYREGLAGLLARFGGTDPAAEVWSFATSGDRHVAWWMRRMAQETAMHRWDVAAAGGGEPAGFDPAFAADGVDEYLTEFLPGQPPETTAGLGGTLHLHATDTEGEWYLDLDEPGVPARREHAKADTAVRGPATELLLWLWNRQPAAGRLEVFGDTGVVDGWTAIRI